MVARVSPPSAPMVGSWFFSFTMLVIRSLDTRPDREISVESRVPRAAARMKVHTRPSIRGLPAIEHSSRMPASGSLTM